MLSSVYHRAYITHQSPESDNKLQLKSAKHITQSVARFVLLAKLCEVDFVIQKAVDPNMKYKKLIKILNFWATRKKINSFLGNKKNAKQDLHTTKRSNKNYTCFRGIIFFKWDAIYIIVKRHCQYKLFMYYMKLAITKLMALCIFTLWLFVHNSVFMRA